MPVKEINDGAACRTYLLWSAKTKEALLVDPLLERAESYLELLRREGLRLTGVLDTHTHADHLSACAYLSEKAGVPYLMHKAAKAACVTRRLEDGETVGVGEERFSLVHTPGHTADSASLLLPGRFLSGDFLFIGSQGAGRLDFAGSDPAAHYDSLKKLDRVPDEAELLPAHDYQGNLKSTMGAERKANPVLTPRGRDEYVRWWNEKKFGAADWMGAVVRANVACTKDPKAVVVPKEGYACACVSSGAEDQAHAQVSPRDLAAELERAPGSVVLLDVRTKDEYDADGHIAGTVLIPVDQIEARLSEVPPGPVVSICRSGKRAAKAASMLKKGGRSEVRVLTGGMLAWDEENLPVA